MPFLFNTKIIHLRWCNIQLRFASLNISYLGWKISDIKQKGMEYLLINISNGRYLLILFTDQMHQLMLFLTIISVTEKIMIGCLSYPTTGLHIRSLAPINVSTSSTTHLKSIHYDHVEIIFSGLRVIQTMFDLLMLHVATWFKETAVLFN